MLKNNYHTHTKRCHHAKDDDEQYILEAINAHMETLGFSDHIPFSKDIPSRIRMSIDEMNEYISTLTSLKEKYKSQINIKIGFEAEYINEEIAFYHDLVEQHIVDYLIFGNHLYNGYYQSSQRIENQKQLYQYLDCAIQGMNSGLFKYIAHPDIFMCNIKDFNDDCKYVTEQICEEALKLDLPLEYNCEGLRDSLNGRIWNNGTNLAYPHPEFWKIAAKKRNKVIIGADAHSSHSLNDKAIELALKQVKELNLNVIDELKF